MITKDLFEEIFNMGYNYGFGEGGEHRCDALNANASWEYYKKYQKYSQADNNKYNKRTIGINGASMNNIKIASIGVEYDKSIVKILINDVIVFCGWKRALKDFFQDIANNC